MEAGGGLRAGAKGRIIDAANMVRPFHHLQQRRRFIELKQEMKNCATMGDPAGARGEEARVFRQGNTRDP